jgi:hypothetical protein
MFQCSIKHPNFFIALKSKKHEYISKDFHTIFNPDLNLYLTGIFSLISNSNRDDHAKYCMRSFNQL